MLQICKNIINVLQVCAYYSILYVCTDKEDVLSTGYRKEYMKEYRKKIVATRVDLNTEQHEELQKILKRDNKTFKQWVLEHIKNDLTQ